MKNPVYLISAGIAVAALAVLQQPTLLAKAPAIHNQAAPVIQRATGEQGARIFKLSGSEIGSPAQPQRWVF